MPLVRYYATRSLTTGVAVGQQLVQSLPIQYAGMTRSRSVYSTTRVSMSGRRETYFERDEDSWSCTIKPLAISDAANIAMFLDSVEGGEGFDFDPSTSLATANLLSNPGFELGATTGWTLSPGGTGHTVSATSRSGSYAGLVTLAVNAAAQLFEQMFSASVGQNWLLQGAAQPDTVSPPNRNTNIQARWGDSGGSLITGSTIGSAAFATAGYQFMNGIVVAPSSTAFLTFRFAKNSPHATDETGRWMLDDCGLWRLSAAPSWRTCQLAQFGYSEPRHPSLDSLVSYQFSIVEIP